MNEYLASALLGLVQGLTEFLPVSSSGHLIITSSLMGFDSARIKIFEVAIQFGSILAVVLLYRRRFLELLFPEWTEHKEGVVRRLKKLALFVVPLFFLLLFSHGYIKKILANPLPLYILLLAVFFPVLILVMLWQDRQSLFIKRFSGLRGLFLLFLTSLPASLIGLFLHDYITEYLFNPLSVAAALATGALFILFAEYKATKREKNAVQSPAVEELHSLDAITPSVAFGVGCFQCLSLWPGFSRSTSTIMGGLLLGADRSTAAEYSFIAAVPILAAATAFTLLKGFNHLSTADIPFFLVGTVMAFISALAAIKFFIGFVSRFSFRPFARYRLILAPLVFWFWS